MGTIVVEISAGSLANPGLDLRHVLTSLIVERSGNALRDDGFDYADEGRTLLIFLAEDDPEHGAATVIENVPILGNNLRSAATITIRSADRSQVVYPRKLLGGASPEL